MELELLNKEKALEFIAQIGKQGEPFEISLGEDICFGNGKWVNVGTISLQPGKKFSDTETQYDEFCAAKFGGFEWQLPTSKDLDDNISDSLQEPEKHKQRVQKAFRQGLQDVIRRTLLLLPIFDVDTISRIPLRKPMTIVPDTSAVHQGGLDFACRFLTPWARIKVPAIVHMEIINQVDNYFKARQDGQKKKKPIPAALQQHLLSQGGQRTLLRIELHSDTEIERGDLGADPLRGIVTPSSDPEDKALGLQNITRSFADRLIVETARHFQTQVRPSHPLALLTSDQGMARMAMAEGIDVLFFQARSVPKFEDKTLTGTLFHPFKQQLYTVPLTDVLWELAVSFGCLRLHNRESDASLELYGIASSEEVTWQPLHSKDDLLWGKFDTGGATLADSTKPDTSSNSQSNPKASQKQSISATAQKKEPPIKGYEFSPDKMFLLIKNLVETGNLTNEQAQEKIGLKHQGSYSQYKNFLRSGSLVEERDRTIISTESLEQLWQSLLHEKPLDLLNHLRKIPSFKAVYQYVNQSRTVKAENSTFPIKDKYKSAYIRLGEAACAWLNIQDKGIVATDNIPDLTDFATLAVDVYKFIRSQEETEWILTGRWLEELALQHAIHPILARKLLQEVQSQKLLNVYVEGSTPDTRFEQHDLSILKTSDEIPELEKVFLYHGNFLIPGTASVRLKVEGVKDAS
ncbi:MAG: hypothetical protein QNJ63_20800 [Calothrix sp. MO_192.B10]|nr:hypothetical protein [Calothrix sp. MO_192.B10]